MWYWVCVRLLPSTGVLGGGDPKIASQDGGIDKADEGSNLWVIDNSRKSQTANQLAELTGSDGRNLDLETHNLGFKRVYMCR
jgi:hypothetical protein